MAKKRKANKKALGPTPRLATSQFIRRFDSTVSKYKEGGLEAFAQEGLLQECGVAALSQTGVCTCEADDEKRIAFGAQPAPPTVSWCSDQEQTQETGGEFILSKLRVVGARFGDYFHRAANDLDEACALSGLTAVYYGMAFCFNIGYGPYESALWYRQLLAQTQQLAKALKANDVMPMRWWSRILKDQSKHHIMDEAVVGAAGRAKYLADLDCDAAVRYEGEAVELVFVQ